MEYSIRFVTYVLQFKGSRDVIESRGQRNSPRHYECGPSATFIGKYDVEEK